MLLSFTVCALVIIPSISVNSSKTPSIFFKVPITFLHGPNLLTLIRYKSGSGYFTSTIWFSFPTLKWNVCFNIWFNLSPVSMANGLKGSFVSNDALNESTSSCSIEVRAAWISTELGICNLGNNCSKFSSMNPVCTSPFWNLGWVQRSLINSIFVSRPAIYKNRIILSDLIQYIYIYISPIYINFLNKSIYFYKFTICVIMFLTLYSLSFDLSTLRASFLSFPQTTNFAIIGS